MGSSWTMGSSIAGFRRSTTFSSRVVLASEGERMGLINAVFETPGEIREHANGRGSDL